MTLMAPKDENELRHMLKTAVSHDGPIALRYPRGAGYGIPLDQELREIPIGTGETLAEGDDVAIIAIGITVLPALEAARTLAEKGIRAMVINARFVKPLDRDLILRAARRTGCIITAEENALQGGFGSAVLELLADEGMTGVRVKRLGIPDRFVEQGPQPQLRADLGIDAAGIAAATEAFLAAKGASAPALSMVK